MFRTTVFASLIALGAVGAAQAQDHGPRLVGGGADGGPRVEYVAPSQNVVGGGYARITGESTNRSIAYSGQTTRQQQSGSVAQLVGGGREQTLVYVPAQAASPTFAGQFSRRGG
ncbi:hypothetical protein JMJ56_28135 [Belnapia sp. T18]|uniref:Curlin associated repeat-containing protein n=1 Tax=Belnapia arida TaxID=2804533 RepID=A0ABS1UAZ6_9PROT|nr:hypothetical protein [Belnapia arida]MBL6081859.1 hypothetical protein [Belnapia arida]